MNPRASTIREEYVEFLKAKMPVAERRGFDPVLSADGLYPHQRDIAAWCVQGGQRAVFASFGLGKTRIHLQVAREVQRHTGGKYLIVAPLGVRQEFTRSDGPAMGMDIRYCRNDAEIAACPTSYVITNYERVRDGHVTVDQFAGAGLDEASVLRSFGSETYQTFLARFKRVRYRFVFTATPSPNKYKELIHYAGFLGIMDTGEALTRFFKRDSSQANNLTLYPHMEEQFWLWISSWAVFIQKPSDLGYSDEGYDLPPMRVHWHCVGVDHHKAWEQTDSWGQAQLFLDQASGLREVAASKRETMLARVMQARELMGVEADPYWREVADGDDAARALFDRHYSRRKYADGRTPKLFVGPGEKAVLLSHDGTALFVWRKFIDNSGQIGVNCAIFRNEGTVKSSVLILAAERFAAQRWPGERLYTFVNAKRIRSTNPGACFKKAGWNRCGETKGGLIILEKQGAFALEARTDGKHWLIWHDLEDERKLIERLIPDARTVYGSQDLEEREDLIMGFSRGEFPILATKPVIAGSGCNFQRHCADAIFLGSSYKFNDFIQACHRIYRFQQGREVNIHIIYAESESPVVEKLKAKWARHDALVDRMTALLRRNKLATDIHMQLIKQLGCNRLEATGERFRLIHNDTVLESLNMENDSVHFICTSIPFGNQYEYTPSFNDFGHNTGDDPFFRQMDFLVPELLRVLKPGRVAAIHVKDRIQFGNVTGYARPSVNPFSDKTQLAMVKHGFIYMGRITVDTDVVRENNQTYRLGWSENAKDSSKMGVGMPEYVLLFYKLPSDLSDGYADERVTKDKGDYPRAQWQIDAAPVWKSGGNRLPSPEVLLHLPMDTIGRLWREYALSHGYDYREHVEIGKELEKRGKLPSSFMLFPPVSRQPHIWSDIARMRTLNMGQSRRGREQHVCPLQLDIIERLIRRYTNKGEWVFDPFMGIGSTAYQAIHMGRCAVGTELNEEYWRHSVGYCEVAENEQTMPTLFDLDGVKVESEVAA